MKKAEFLLLLVFGSVAGQDPPPFPTQLIHKAGYCMMRDNGDMSSYHPVSLYSVLCTPLVTGI